MYSRLFTLLTLSGSLASAWVSTSSSATTAVVCSTLSGSGGLQPTPIPRSTEEVDAVTFSSDRGTYTVERVVPVTVATVTTTQYTTTAVTWVVETVSSPTLTSFAKIVSTVATAVVPSTVCNNGVVPTTVTEYTGTYTPVSGQATTLPSTYPTLIACAQSVTTYLGLYEVVTVTKTESVTATSVVLSATATTTSTVTLGKTTVYGATVTTTTTSYTVANTLAVKTTACEETTTTTLAAKCAPTNLIGAINGVGLVSGTYASNSSVTYGPREDTPFKADASLCCQLCEDNEGCAGLMWSNGVCGLLYVADGANQAQCTEVFTFKTQANVVAGEGLVVQSGCGSIRYQA
ncbi:hypothetical protein GQ53DRAFT_746107 [Thozetella sp. PMI_491]|nr:hypothetical protein GQ53DRAFT_746107 [Thozetella sp. PMI_491]